MKSRRKGSILIFMIWILVILGMFAATVAFRARVGIKIASFHDRQFFQRYLSQSAVNYASYLLNADDDPKTDSAEDAWYGELKDTANFPFKNQLDMKVTDEESKLNLNQATPVILKHLFEILAENGIQIKTDPDDLISSMMAWRGGRSVRGATTIGYEHKRAPFESIDELRLIQHITPGDAERLRPYVTVFAARTQRTLKVNINTVNDFVLKAVIQSLTGTSRDQLQLYDHLQIYRKGNPDDPEGLPPSVFEREDLTPQSLIDLLELESSPGMVRLMNQFARFVTVDSQFFTVHIETKKASSAGHAFFDAVLGPNRMILIKRSRGSGFTRRFNLNDVLRGYPFEVLSWREGAL